MTAITPDQQLVLPDYTEPADGPLDFYQFATGGLESRLVKRYASAADRTARNPSPQTNEYSVRNDAVGTLEYFNGTTWVPYGPIGAISSTTRSAAVGGITSTETVTDSITFTAVTGRRYKFTHSTLWSSSAADDVCQFRIRYIAGASPTIAGSTQVMSYSPNADRAGRPENLCVVKDIVSIPAGQTTIFITLMRSAGTGTLSSNPFNEAQGTSTILEDIGV